MDPACLANSDIGRLLPRAEIGRLAIVCVLEGKKKQNAQRNNRTLFLVEQKRRPVCNIDKVKYKLKHLLLVSEWSQRPCVFILVVNGTTHQLCLLFWGDEVLDNHVSAQDQHSSISGMPFSNGCPISHRTNTRIVEYHNGIALMTEMSPRKLPISTQRC